MADVSRPCALALGSEVVMNKIDLARHMLATAAYRFQRAIRGAPPAFADFRASGYSRSPRKIVRHMTNMLVQTHRCFVKEDATQPSVDEWEGEIDEFHNALRLVDRDLEDHGRIEDEMLKKLVQGPISDVLTHIGQIALLRGMTGVPLEPERFTAAEIVVGRVGRNQSESVTPYIERQ